MLVRVVSGGQTGVDRAGLDVALELGLEVGGYCPRGRLAEDGLIPEKYTLTELRSRSYPVRTEQNVIHSDATLIVASGALTGGTALTKRLAETHGKPLFVALLSNESSPSPTETQLRDWLISKRVRVLNVAGPRASTAPELPDLARPFLRRVLSSH